MAGKSWRFTVLLLLGTIAVFLFFVAGNQVRPVKSIIKSVKENSQLIPAPVPRATVFSAPSLTAVPISMPALKDIRAIYATAQTAAKPARIEAIINLIKNTELNALVVNVKDSDGVYLDEGMARLVKRLLANGIYPIARIVVFQDNFLAKIRPDLALKSADGSLWQGNGNAFWIDPASAAAWDYNTGIAEAALAMGFKEINLDYIRFPSEGDTGGAVYPFYNASTSKDKVLGDFFAYFSSRVKADYPQAVLSADLFAFSLVADNGLGVGQRVPIAAKYFDVLCPMIYPSHYSAGDFGFDNPADYPYAVVADTLADGRKYFPASLKKVVVRPWLQSFDLGAIYDPVMVRAEIRAVADQGFGNTWSMWNPDNVYNQDNFLKRPL